MSTNSLQRFLTIYFFNTNIFYKSHKKEKCKDRQNQFLWCSSPSALGEIYFLIN